MTSLNDIYKSSYLKHPLTEDEYLNIKNAWEFLKHFERKEVSLMDYRQRIINKSRNIIYSKPAEGSSPVLMKNYFNLYSFTIFHTRNIYEEFMKDPYNNVNIDTILPQFYHEQTYPFPNLNFCSYKLGTQNDRKERIQKMYYNGTDEYWFSLIK